MHLTSSVIWNDELVMPSLVPIEMRTPWEPWEEKPLCCSQSCFENDTKILLCSFVRRKTGAISDGINYADRSERWQMIPLCMQTMTIVSLANMQHAYFKDWWIDSFVMTTSELWFEIMMYCHWTKRNISDTHMLKRLRKPVIQKQVISFWLSLVTWWYVLQDPRNSGSTYSLCATRQSTIPATDHNQVSYMRLARK